MVCLVGAISYKMYARNSESNEKFFPLLKCHLQKMTIARIFRCAKETETEALTLFVQEKSFTTHFLRDELLKNVAVNENEIGILKCTHLNINTLSLVIPLEKSVSLIVKLSKGLSCSDSAVSGVVWSTCQGDQSAEEFWLASDKIDITHFLMSIASEKKMMRKGDIILYKADKLSDYVSSGQAQIGSSTLRFSRISVIDHVSSIQI